MDTEAAAVTLAELFSANLVSVGDLVTVSLPSQYNDDKGSKFQGTGTITDGGTVFYANEPFQNLSDFHRFLKNKRARELRDKGMHAPKNPTAPTSSTISKTTTIEGTPMLTLARKLIAKKQVTGNIFPPSKKKLDSGVTPCEVLTLDPSLDDEDEVLPDASMDPFNDYDSLPESSDGSQIVNFNSENSQAAPSVEKIKEYPPQEIEYPSIKSVSSSNTDSSMDDTYVSDDSCPLTNKQTGSEELELELDELLEDPHSRNVPAIHGLHPQTAEMLSLNLDTFSRTDSTEIRQQHSRQNLKQDIPKPDARVLSPVKETLLKNAAKQKIKELRTNKKKITSPPPTRSPEKISKYFAPVSPTFSPPRKFRKPNTGPRKALYKDSPEIITVEDSSLPSPEVSEDSMEITSQPPHKHIPEPVEVSPPPTLIPSKNSIHLRTSITSPEPISYPSPPTSQVSSNPNPLASSTSSGNPIIIASGLTSTMMDQLTRLANKIGGDVVSSFSNEVTHAVLFCDKHGVPKTTMKLQKAILYGTWIVSFTCKYFVTTNQLS